MALVVQEAILEGKLGSDDKTAILEHLEALSEGEPHGNPSGDGRDEQMGDLIDDAISVLRSGGPAPQKDIARYGKDIGATPDAGSGRSHLEKSGVVMRDKTDNSGPGPLHPGHSVKENGIEPDLSVLDDALSGDGYVAATLQSPFEMHALTEHGGGTRPKAKQNAGFEWDDNKKVLKVRRPAPPVPKPLTKIMKWNAMMGSRNAELSPSFAKPLSDPITVKTPREQHKDQLERSGGATGIGSVEIQ
jgi:hypothetical protein